MVGVSALGGVTHNIAQILMAVWLLGTWGVALHLPLLVVIGVTTGVANGLVVNMLRARSDLRPILDFGSDTRV